MTVERIFNDAGMAEFIRFPWKVYRGSPNWVPPLLREIKFVLSDRNPFSRHAEAAFFLARKAKKTVGRIAAIIDHNHINFHKEQAGFFGFFECLPDLGIAEELVDHAAFWLRERGIKVMRGPMNPSTNDECGLLLNGFDSAPMIMMPYTPPYYLELMEQCGFSKAKDLFAYIAVINDVPVVERLERLSKIVQKRVPGLTVRPVRMKAFDDELTIIKNIYNAAWNKNWGFIPMTDEEMNSMAERLKPLLVPELLLIAEVDDRPAAFFMVVPDYNQVIHKLNGKLLPFGIFKFFWYARKITDIRCITLGVKEEYRKKGIEGLLYLEAFRAATRKGYQHAEMSWILEDNTLMQKGCELMGGKLYKKYRIFEKNI